MLTYRLAAATARTTRRFQNDFAVFKADRFFRTGSPAGAAHHAERRIYRWRYLALLPEQLAQVSQARTDSRGLNIILWHVKQAEAGQC